MSFDHDLDVFVREVLQNSLDARRNDLGSAVVVRFALHELRGADKQAALEAAGWETLRRHIDAARSLAPQFGEAIQRADDPRSPLSMLCVHDGNALGMSGPEKGEGRFAMFARNKLLSDKQSSDAGGAFGLGKSVLWAYSGMSTVFVHSVPMPDGHYQHASRFLGISQLPWHEVRGSQYDGPGWFGAGRQEPDGTWSVSHPADSGTIGALKLVRDHAWDTGTSLCIPDFLGTQDCDSAVDLANVLKEAAARWFWPALAGSSPRLVVEIATREDVEVVDVAAMPAVRPFLHLGGLLPQSHWVPHTASGTAPLKLPTAQDSMRGQKGFTWHTGRQVEDAFAVDAIALDEGHGDQRGKLALVRGARMVVDYVDLRADRPTYALARAGTARGDREADKLVEQFLRLAEPPSHKDWSAKAPKLAPTYKRGYRGELNGLRRRLADRALELLRRREAESRSAEIPKALRRALSMRSGGSRSDLPAAGRFDYRITQCQLVLATEQPGWEFAGHAQQTREGPWLLDVECGLAGDAMFVRLPLASFDVDGLQAKEQGRGYQLPREGRITFRGFCPLLEQGRHARLAKFGVRMRARTLAMEAETAADAEAGL